MVVPVGILDDDLHFRVHSLCRLHDELTPCIGHQSQTIVSPALITLCGNLFVILQVDEEKVIEDEVIEMLRCEFGDLPYLLPFYRTGIAIGFEVGRF